jgi:hypothetical protein
MHDVTVIENMLWRSFVIDFCPFLMTEIDNKHTVKSFIEKISTVRPAWMTKNVFFVQLQLVDWHLELDHWHMPVVL